MVAIRRWRCLGKSRVEYVSSSYCQRLPRRRRGVVSHLRWRSPAPRCPAAAASRCGCTAWATAEAPTSSSRITSPTPPSPTPAGPSPLRPPPLSPATVKSVNDEEDVLRAVQSVHAMIDREIAAGTDPEDVFVFGLSQGGALGIASVLLYPKTLGGCAVFSGFLPFSSSSFASRVTDEAKMTPVLWIHGGADSLVPIGAGRNGAEFLRGLGMSCEFKVYDRLGHTLAPFELEYCERWASENVLKQQRRGLNLKKDGGSRRCFFGGVFNCLFSNK